MRGCLFTLALGAVVIALAVVVGLPALAAGVLTAGITAAGLQSDDIVVSVASDPPTDLLGLHADRVRIRATDATFRGLVIGELEIALGDVAFLQRTAGTVDGSLRDVTVPDIGGRGLALAAITLSGGGDSVSASTTVAGSDVRAILARAIEAELGVRPSAVTLSGPDRVTVRVGIAVQARIGVSPAGDLVMQVLDGPEAGRSVTLLRGGQDLPIRFTAVRVTGTGDLRLSGDLSIGLPGWVLTPGLRGGVAHPTG